VTDPVPAALRADLPCITQRLAEYVRIPSVSTDSAYADGIRAEQNFLRLARQRWLSGRSSRPVRSTCAGLRRGRSPSSFTDCSFAMSSC
jgi:hypothetical protein